MNHRAKKFACTVFQINSVTYMGKTFRRRAVPSSAECIRVGGHSSTTLRFNPCGWNAHAEANEPSASARRCRPDGALKNKGTRSAAARSCTKAQLVHGDALGNFMHVDELVDCSRDVCYVHQERQVDCESYFGYSLETEQQQDTEASQRHLQHVAHQRPKFSQQLGGTFEEKLLNSVARDVSLLCMAHLAPRLELASTDVVQTIQVEVPLCEDFKIKTLDCIKLQLVSSKGNMDDAHSRPWRLNAACEQALSSALQRRVASALHVHASGIQVSAKLSLGYCRYTYKDLARCEGRPLLYMWATALVPHASVVVSREILDAQSTAAVAFAELRCVRNHLKLWRLFRMSQIAEAEERKSKQTAAAELARELHAAELKKIQEARRSAGHRKRPLSVKVQLY